MPLTGRAKAICDGSTVEVCDAAEHLMRFAQEELIHVEGALPVTWELEAYSRVLEKTGSCS